MKARLIDSSFDAFTTLIKPPAGKCQHYVTQRRADSITAYLYITCYSSELSYVLVLQVMK